MSGIVVRGADLEFYPSCWNCGAALHASFEGGREADKGCCAGGDGGGVLGMVEVCSCCAVAVPEVVVEVEGLGLVGSVG